MANHVQKVLLTGASGAVGIEVLEQLVEQNERFEIVVIDVRRRQVRKRLSKFKRYVTLIYGDITEPEVFKAVGGRVDVVIHLAAVIPPKADEDPMLAEQVNVGGTENLLNYLGETSPGAFLLYSSSIAVYGDRLKDPWIQIGDPLQPSPGDKYARTKLRAESLVQNSGLRWSIFRLTAVMGNHALSKLMFHQPLETKMEIATTEDTGRAFVKAIDNLELIEGKIFNLGGGESCRVQYDKFLKESFRVIGLGEFRFPDKSFAEKNFHCGYYADSDELEVILHFQKDDLPAYYKKEVAKYSGFKRALIQLFRKRIIKKLLSESEPYTAYKSKDQKQLAQFFDLSKEEL